MPELNDTVVQEEQPTSKPFERKTPESKYSESKRQPAEPKVATVVEPKPEPELKSEPKAEPPKVAPKFEPELEPVPVHIPLVPTEPSGPIAIHPITLAAPAPPAPPVPIAVAPAPPPDIEWKAFEVGRSTAGVIQRQEWLTEMTKLGMKKLLTITYSANDFAFIVEMVSSEMKRATSTTTFGSTTRCEKFLVTEPLNIVAWMTKHLHATPSLNIVHDPIVFLPRGNQTFVIVTVSD